MATRKCRNIYFPKYFMAVRKFTNIYIPKYLCTSAHVHIIPRLFHMPCATTTLKKNYGPTERGIVTSTLTAAVATSVTSLHEAPCKSSGRYRFPTYANNVAFREMSSTAPMKYYRMVIDVLLSVQRNGGFLPGISYC